MSDIFLPGVDVDWVTARLTAAGGNELGSGKLQHPESSAALAVNTFGFFVRDPSKLPALPGCESFGSANVVDVEFCARFPWRGGRHPWLDAVVETDTHLVGVESKRFEPFRDTKRPAFSSAYGVQDWGCSMQRYVAMQARLIVEDSSFRFLDAAQLVKHAYGLATEGRRRGKVPVLYYLFAEPAVRAGQLITGAEHSQHRGEVDRFAQEVAGDNVQFLSASYREWLSTWPDDGELGHHKVRLLMRFRP